jgi:PAS domain S-box-containing protein
VDALEREHANTSLAALVAAVEEYAIYMLDPVGRIITWNAGARRIKGYTDSEVIGQHFSLFFTNDDISDGKPQMLLAAAASDEHASHEGWRVRRDGSRFWANVSITAVFDATGDVVGYVKVTRDDTARQEAQRQADELRQLRERDELARQVNNEVINRIFSAGLVIETIRTLVRDDLVVDRVNTAVGELDRAINDLRAIVLAVRDDTVPDA